MNKPAPDNKLFMLSVQLSASFNIFRDVSASLVTYQQAQYVLDVHDVESASRVLCPLLCKLDPEDSHLMSGYAQGPKCAVEDPSQSAGT